MESLTEILSLSPDELTEITAFPVQEFHEELPNDISALDLFLSQIGKHKLLTKEEEFKYATLTRQGDRNARNKMINCNLRLVVKIAKRYQNKGLDLLDLIQEGIIGLMTAVRKFEPERGFRFTTYAHHWIEQAVTRGIFDKGRTIRLPVHAYQDVNRIYSALNKNENLTHEELAEKLNLSMKKVEFYQDAVRDAISYDIEINEEGNTVLDFIEDEEHNVENNVLSEAIKEKIVKALSTLKPRQQEVLIKRFGLLGETERTLEELGKEIHVTRERVRQIEIEACEKIKSNLESIWDEGVLE